MAKYRNVLMVDDDPLTLMVCEKLMKIADFTQEVISFTNGADALDYLYNKLSKHAEEPLPQIILLDLYMQGMNGWDFLEKFKNLKAKPEELPPVTILSSTISQEDKDKGLSYTFVKNFLTKPLSVAHFERL